MSIKGYKSQQALQQKLSGFTEDQSIDRQRYVTVQEMNGHRHALDVLIHGAYQIGGTLTVASGSNIRVIRCVSHGALVNDIIRLSNGTEFAALSVPDADTIVTSTELLADPTADTFTVWRHVTPAYTSTGALNVVTSTAAQSGSYAEDLTVTTTPETFTAPPGAFKCLVYADDTNTVNIRVKMGAAATITSGLQLQAGRSESFDGGSNVSYCTESGTAKINIHWFVRQI